MKEIYKFRFNSDFDIVICNMPMRKKPCLAIKERNTITKYASFNDEESAEEFISKFTEFIGAKNETI